VTALKRVSMAGADVAVTDATIADLVLEYAMHLGRSNSTDIVAVPIPDEGAGDEVDLLLGPASQIVLSGSNDHGRAELPRVPEVRDDLRARIEHITGRSAAPTETDVDFDPLHAFVDFDEFGEPRTDEARDATKD
jgi:hypothetical protein